MLDLTAARRRSRRWREAVVGIAAALIIAGGVFGGLSLGSSPAQPPSAAAGSTGVAGSWHTVTGQMDGMTATVRYRSVGWGTELDTKVNGIPVDSNCQLWVVDSSGNRVLAGSWQTDNAEGTVWYPGSAALAAKNVGGFQVTVADQQQSISVRA